MGGLFTNKCQTPNFIKVLIAGRKRNIPRKGTDLNEKQSFFLPGKTQSMFFLTHFEIFTTQRSNVFIRKSQSRSPFYPVLEVS